LADKFDPSGRGLSREDEMLARVVMDLGIAKASAIESAIDRVSQARTRGESAGLSQVLRDSGCLHPRFATVVERVVKTRLGLPDTQAAASAQPSAPRTAPPAAAAKPPAAVRSAPSPAKPSAPQAPSPEEHPGESAPNNAVYGQARRGQGFSVRSRKDIASAWAAFKGGPGDTPSSVPAAGAAGVSHREAAPAGTPPAEHTARPSPLAGAPSKPPAEPEKPLFPVRARPKDRPEARDGGEVERLVPPTSGLGKQQPLQPAKQAYRPRRGREDGHGSGVTESIDIDSLREELGITGKARSAQDASESEEVAVIPVDERQKEIALKAFVKRIVPSMNHQHALDVVLRKRLTTISPMRLSEELGCKEREARRVLEDWRQGGIARQEDSEIFQYLIVPSKADLALIREFLTLWNETAWHQKMLGWIIEQGR
jgi:hypothetical protein